MFSLFLKCFRDWLNEIVKTVLKILVASDIRGIITQLRTEEAKKREQSLSQEKNRKVF